MAGPWHVFSDGSPPAECQSVSGDQEKIAALTRERDFLREQLSAGKLK